MSTFSLPFVAVKFLSRSHSESVETFNRTYLSFLNALLFLTSTAAAIAVVLVIFGADLLGDWLFQYKFLLVLGLLAVPTIPVRGFLSNVLAAAQHPRTSALMALGISVVLVLAAYGGIFLGGVTGYYWANLGGGLFIVVATIYVLHGSIGLPVFDRRASIFEELKRSPDIVPFCLILSVLSFTHPTAFFVARYAILSNHGEVMTGLLHAVIALGLALNMVLTPTNGLLLAPMMNRDIPNGEKFRRAIEYQRMLILILAVGALPLVLFPKAILTLLFSPAFSFASPYLFGFVVSEVVLLLSGVYQSIIVGLDDIKAHMVICVLAHLCIASVSWSLAPQYGIAGVAAAFVAGNLLLLILANARLVLKHQFQLPRSLGWFMAYLILGLLAFGAVASTYDDADFAVIFAKTVTGLVFAAGVAFFLDKEERASVCRLLTGVHLRRARASDVRLG